MARDRRRQGGPRSPVPGFRPGKEPPRLKKQRAKQQFGDNVSPAQERLIDLFAERTPEQARTLIRRWSIGGVVTAVLLAIAGALLLTWSTVAGVIVLILAAAVLILWWRMYRRKDQLEAMADVVSGGG